MDSELSGVTLPNIVQEDDSIFRLNFSLKEYNLTLATTYGTYFLDDSPRFLASKIFLYHERRSEKSPLAEIVIWRTKQKDRDLCGFEVNWLRPQEITLIRDHKFEAKRCGALAAEELIKTFYQMKGYWSDNRPTLGQLLEDKALSCIGF